MENTLEWNGMFTKPLPKNVVKTATESAEKAYFDWLSGEMVKIGHNVYRKGYNYRNDTLIKMLGITEEEQRQLSTIIGKEEKYRRNNERRTGRDESGLTAAQRQRAKRDKQIMEMHEQGLSNREIGKLMRISHSTVAIALDQINNTNKVSGVVDF